MQGIQQTPAVELRAGDRGGRENGFAGYGGVSGEPQCCLKKGRGVIRTVFCHDLCKQPCREGI